MDSRERKLPCFLGLFPPKVITFIIIFSKAPAGFLRPLLSVNRRLDGPLSFHHVPLSSYPSSHLQNLKHINLLNYTKILIGLYSQLYD